MSRHDDPHTYDENLLAENTSPDRPPQFNASSCGYRCGWGCCEPMGGDDEGGGGYDSDGTPTLIGSEVDGEFERMARQDGDESISPGVSDPQQEMENERVPLVVDDFEDNILLNLPVPVHAEIFSPEPSEWEYQGSADSLENQAASGTHSSAASDKRRIGSASPYGWDALMDGLGTWDDMEKVDRLPGYFCVTPLRLSPQIEHCRGNAASHLVFQDYSTLLESGIEDHRRRMFSYDMLPYLNGGPNIQETTWVDF